jgi:predicted nucleic acid-binding protein
MISTYAYPYDKISLNENTKIFIDACFPLIILCNENDRRYKKCINIKNMLTKYKCQFFITTVVASEIVNQIMNYLFVHDIQSIANEDERCFNNEITVYNILALFKEKDVDIITGKKFKEFDRIPYKQYFNKTYKNDKTKKLLSFYFKRAIQIYYNFEKNMRINYLNSSDKIFTESKKLIRDKMLTINDAQHLMSAIIYNMDYILTLDGDFNIKLNKEMNVLTI